MYRQEYLFYITDRRSVIGHAGAGISGADTGTGK
jgi:hypothetical protein